MTRGLVVTGGAGWLGMNLLADMRASPPTGFDEVRVLVETSADGRRVREALPGARVVVGDLRADRDVQQLMAGLDATVVVHAAGVIHPASVRDFLLVNAVGTRIVLMTALRHGLERFVHVSSNSPIGTNPSPAEVFRDCEPYAPYYGYGRSKMLAELVVRDLLDAAGVPGTILRPPWFYGPRQPERQARFLRSVRLGRFPIVGSGGNRRSMVFVGHLVQGVRLALETERPGVDTYWIADRTPYTMLEVIAAVREAAALEGLEVRGGSTRLPDLVGTLAEKADGFLQSRGVYQQELHVVGELNKTIACSVEGAERDLGFRPTTSLVDGMRHSYRSGLESGQSV